MIASLPMYWRAETAGLWRSFWALVQDEARRRDLVLPDLTEPEAVGGPLGAHWLRRDLALSMTCSLPFRTVLRGQVSYVGTLDFGLGDAPGYYHSVVVARRGETAEDPAGLVLAFNGPDSQSGWAVAAGQRFRGHLCTGAHALSVRAVAEGRADIAYIDAVTWRLLQRHDPQAGRLQVVARTDPTPGLPLIAAPDADIAGLRAALRAAVARFRPDDPAAIGGPLSFVELDVQSYLDLPVPLPPPCA